MSWDTWSWIVERRAAVPGSHREGGDKRGGHRQQRELQRLDQDLHRPRLCAAIVDRLPYAGIIIETGTVSSYRLAHARAQRTAAR
jgi:hypothetical protein